MDFNDFIREEKEVADKWVTQPIVKDCKHCEAGNFWYHFEDDRYYYKIAGKTRTMVHRFPKGFESMANRKLFEKTPSEKGRDDIFQRKLLEKET